ncbi:MAG: copper resistance protein CopC [Actinomycetota bacterium]
MKRRARTTAGLLASVAALLLAAGMVPAAADPPKDVKVSPREDSVKHRAPDKVVVTFSEEAPEDTSITVSDACERTVSAKKTTVSGDQATVNLNKAPRGRYRVRVSYTVAAEPEPPPGTPPPGESPSPTPTDTPPPDEETEKWGYSFEVHAGPDCDGSGGGNGDKPKYSWGSTSDPGHHGGAHAASPSNPITAGTTHSGHAGSATSPTTSSPAYTPFFSSPSTTTDHSTYSAIPDFDSDFGGSAFESTTEDTPLSDPTDPTLADPESEVIAPEEADDEQSLSAAPTDSLEPESGVLVVALAAALLLGAGGGLFLRKADPAPARK